MKKFKYNVGVIGPKALVVAWAKHVVELGYLKRDSFHNDLLTLDIKSAVVYGKGGMGVHFYGFSPACDYLYTLPEQWEESLAKATEEEFTLPEKWCIKQNLSQEVCKWFAKYRSTASANINGSYTYLCFDREKQYATFEYSSEDYTEITLEQFIEHVLNKEMVEEPMKIAGYNVTFKEDKVSIGCYKNITLKELKTFRKAIKVVKKFDITLKIGRDEVFDAAGNLITLKQIEQLIERLDG